MKIQNKTVIKVLSVEHGEKVIKWFKDQGVSTNGYTGEMVGDYYGLSSSGTFTNSSTVNSTYNVIELPLELPKRGDNVLVWDYNEKSAVEKIFLAYIEGLHNPVICVSQDDETNFLNDKLVTTTSWKHYKLIEPKVKVELTLDEIAAKFRIDVSQLKIKK